MVITMREDMVVVEEAAEEKVLPDVNFVLSLPLLCKTLQIEVVTS